MSRQNRTSKSDIIAGSVLITIGIIGLIARLGMFSIPVVPHELLRWWPLLLIVTGVGLWAFERDGYGRRRSRREARDVL